MRTYVGFVLVALIIVVAGGRAAHAQFLPDDAGETATTAAQLHVGVNEGRFDYKVPRGLDVDVWELPTQSGKVYSIRSLPIDDMTESYNALPQTQYFGTLAIAFANLGFTEGPDWTRGNGYPITRTLRGLAKRDGTPVRYRIEVVEGIDTGDPEGDDLASATRLTVGTWFNGSHTAPAPLPPPVAYGYSPVAGDIDAFTFAFEDRGIYRIELEVGGGATASSYAQWKGIAARTSAFATSARVGTIPAADHFIEFRGTGTAWFTLAGSGGDAPSCTYRVRVVRTGTAASDDHGDTPDLATTIQPSGPATRATLSTRLSTTGSLVIINDPDWFSVQTVAGHSYEARVERAGVSVFTSSVSDVPAEDGTNHADAMVSYHQLAPYTNLLASVRFRGRAGPPVKFGLLGSGNVTVTVIDLGTVIDDLGDPLTGAAVISMEHPTITGRLENPRDVDSFTVEAPSTPGIYYLNYTMSAWNSQDGFSPGYALTTPTGRAGGFHISNNFVQLTRRTDGLPDSFPARMDMLCKAWPGTEYPLIGPVLTYSLTLTYHGPLPTTTTQTPDDDAPPDATNAAVLEPGHFVTYFRQGAGDAVDTALLNLRAGRVYSIAGSNEGGEIIAPSGQAVTQHLRADNSSERQFVVSTDGLYLQRRDYTVPSYNYAYRLVAGVNDYGAVTDDQPDDAPARRLAPGTITGTIDFTGDHDAFELPHDAGGFYRVTITSETPFVINESQDSYYSERAGSVVQYVYFPESVLQGDAKRFTVASTSTSGTYEVRIEKLLQLHPSDDLPDALGLRYPLQPGETGIAVQDRRLDRDILEFNVRAGRLYHINYESLATYPSYPSLPSLVMPVYDELDRQVQHQDVGHSMRADADGVWHIDFGSGWQLPVRLTIVDDGAGDDDYGSGEATSGQLAAGATATGTLERAGDVDGWRIVGELPAGSRVRVTATDLDRGTEVVTEHYNVSESVMIDEASFPAGGTIPLHYSLRFETLPPFTPPTVCLPDLGKAGGLPGRDGLLDNNDLVVFISYYFATTSVNRNADMGGAGGVHQPDGWLDSNDFVAFIDLFFAGCG